MVGGDQWGLAFTGLWRDLWSSHVGFDCVQSDSNSVGGQHPTVRRKERCPRESQ